MFAKTFAFWGRLLGKTPAAPAAKKEDRRLWVRYPADLQSQVQVGDKGPTEKILANVRDLSRGGANLLVEHPLQPGQMLSLELPNARNETITVLACVVRAIPHEGGQWSLGCVFSRELDGEDLGPLGTQKKKATGADQRIWVRYECPVKANFRKFGEPLSDAKPVQVLNISASGIGLVVQSAFEAGALLTLDLLDKTGRKACTILACVVHTASRAGGEFAVGCNFIRELTEEELASLL